MAVLPPELDLTYEILAEMGRGGMGTIYKARHRHFDEICVLKLMRGPLHEHDADRFLAEAKRGKLIHHPNVAAVRDFQIAADGTAALVMEYVDGENLRQMLGRGPVGYKTAVSIATQTLSALGALHEQNLVHRDISPENIMVAHAAGGAPVVKLIDLGIAKALDDANHWTKTNAFIGKARYAAPEQFINDIDARSDIYSFGIVLYELLTGVAPIVGADIGSFALAHIQSAPLPFSKTDPQNRVPETLRRVVMKAIEKPREKRFQTAAQFADALRGMEAEYAKTVETKNIDYVPPPRSRYPQRAIMLSVATVVVAALSLAFNLKTRSIVTRPPTDTSVSAPTVDKGPVREPAAAALARGKDLIAAGRTSEAYDAYVSASKSDPTNAMVWANLGAAASALNKPAEAVKAYENALGLQPGNWLAHYNLGCILARAGQPDAALGHIERAVSQLKLESYSPNKRASILSGMRTDEALKSLNGDPRFKALFR